MLPTILKKTTAARTSNIILQQKKVPRPGVVNQNQKKSHLDTQGTHGKEHHRQRRAIPEGAIGPSVVVKAIHKERKSSIESC